MLNEKRPQSADETQAAPAESQQWQSLGEFVDDAQFAEVMESQFPREAAVLKRSGMNRRQFMKVMGASVVMGGLSLSGCTPTRREHEEIIPYVRMPEEIIPGRPLFFASTMVTGGYATGVVIETHEGRPQRVEGNKNHPASLGGSDVMLLASILELYNPERSNTVLENGTASTLEAFRSTVADALSGLGDGSGLRILTEATSSPTMIDTMERVLEAYPGAQWVQYEPLSRDNVAEGARIAFRENVTTYYDFSSAATVVSLDADFMTSMPGSLRYARDFAAGRTIRAETTTMNRLYAAYSTPSITSTAADNSLALLPAQISDLAVALAAAVGVEGIEAPEASWDTAWFEAMVADLEANAGSGIVVAGDDQPAVVHALVHAINAALGNAGETVLYTDPVLSSDSSAAAQLATLVDEMAGGDVDALIVLGGNPAYDAPADIDFAGAMASVGLSVHLSLYNNETSQLANWHVPRATYFEAWGDALAYDGTASLIQPPIGTLWDTELSDLDVAALLAGEDRSSYEVLQAYWADEYDGDDFEGYWRRALHDGVLADTTPDTFVPSVSGTLASDVEALLPESSEGLVVLFRPDASVYDGRYANNSWLHEMPHPITKIAWDNVGMMSAATAEELRVRNGDLINVTYEGRTMQIPAWVVPRHVDGAISIGLGYGTGIGGDVEAGLSFNAYDIRTSEAAWAATGATVERAGRSYQIAQVQKEFDGMGHDFVSHTTLDGFVADPDFAKKKLKSEASFLEPSEWDYNGYAWGMTIDLTSCIGCNACMIACQSENNIPSVGKGEVLQERDMAWLRIDLYYEDGDTYFQPVPCMHCENAPCEQVCPVQATVHDHEGINNMVYNRCIGTRTCAANCPYSVRRFNFLDYVDPAPILEEQRNPDVSVRVRGVMEKCTYCWQRINAGRITSSVEDRPLFDGEVQTACQTACPTQAITFGDINDPNSAVSVAKAQPHNYGILEELNTKPRTTYLGRVTNPNTALASAEAAEEDQEG